MTVGELTEEVGISIGLYHDILTKKFNIYRAAAKFFRHLMIEQQKKNREDVCLKLLEQANGDESWV